MVTAPPSASFGPPMAQVGVDLFDCGGKTHLLCVDRWSGFPLFKRLQSQSTKAVTDILSTWFNILGWPTSIRSDGGPQFCGPFRAWCQQNNISHELSAPYNTKSNGLAESAVKNVKLVLAKCSETGQDPHRTLYEWRNIPRTNGFSPAQLLFGRPQYTALPSLPVHHQFYNIDTASAAKDATQLTEKKYHDQHKSFLPELSVGQAVLLQDPKTRLWNHDASIIAVRPDKLSYIVRSRYDGREFNRSRRMIRTVPNGDSSAEIPGRTSHTLSVPRPGIVDRLPPGTPPTTSAPLTPSAPLAGPSSVATASFASSWVEEDPSPVRQRPRTPNKDRQTTIKSLINPKIQMPSSSLTGPRSDLGCRRLSSSAPLLCSSSTAGGRTKRPIKRPTAPSSTNSRQLLGTEELSRTMTPPLPPGPRSNTLDKADIRALLPRGPSPACLRSTPPACLASTQGPSSASLDTQPFNNNSNSPCPTWLISEDWPTLPPPSRIGLASRSSRHLGQGCPSSTKCQKPSSGAPPRGVT